MKKSEFLREIREKIKQNANYEDLLELLSDYRKAGEIDADEVREYWKAIQEEWANRDLELEIEINQDFLIAMFEKLYNEALMSNTGFDLDSILNNVNLKPHRKLIEKYAIDFIEEQLIQGIIKEKNGLYYSQSAYEKIDTEIKKKKKTSSTALRKMEIYKNVARVTADNWFELYKIHYFELRDSSKKLIWADYQVNNLFELMVKVQSKMKNPKHVEIIEDLFLNCAENKYKNGTDFFRMVYPYLTDIFTEDKKKMKEQDKLFKDVWADIRGICMGAEPYKLKNIIVWKPRGLFNNKNWDKIFQKYMAELYDRVLNDYFPMVKLQTLRIKNMIKNQQLVGRWKYLLYLPDLKFTTKNTTWDFIIAENEKMYYSGYFVPALGKEMISLHELMVFGAFQLNNNHDFALSVMHHETCHLIQYKYNMLRDWVHVNGIPDGYEDEFERAMRSFVVQADMENLNVQYEGSLISVKDYFYKLCYDNNLIIEGIDGDYPSYEQYSNSFQGHDPGFMYHLNAFGKKKLSNRIDTKQCENSIKQMKSFEEWINNYGDYLYGTRIPFGFPTCSPNQPQFPFNPEFKKDIPGY